jgi:hypothetical protein
MAGSRAASGRSSPVGWGTRELGAVLPETCHTRGSTSRLYQVADGVGLQRVVPDTQTPSDLGVPKGVCDGTAVDFVAKECEDHAWLWQS